MSKIRGEDKREFDKTQLHEKMHGQLVHRDYASHFFRWGFAGRLITNKDEVLEVGCGQDTPLVKVLSRTGMFPKRYVGVDLNKPVKNKLGKEPHRTWATFHWEFNFIKDHKKLGGKFTRAVCFEVIEHMQKPLGLKLLNGIFDQLKPGGELLLSTPIFNGKQAANHIHEYEGPELQAHIERAGFKVMKRFGTFMSKPSKAAQKKLSLAHLESYHDLEAYYGGEVMACFLAPMYPELSRNNLWICRRP